MSETSQKSGKKTYVGDLDVDELRAYIGLMYFRGLLGLSKHSVSRLWGKDGHVVFASTMSMERFKFLASKIAKSGQIDLDLVRQNCNHFK